ncbi:MAG: hypothetical protein ACXVII_36845, partial [Solirubrobacteraceae bacterium]
SAMADALSCLAEMQLSAISVSMAFLAGWIATLAGDSAAAERSLRDALSLIRGPGRPRGAEPVADLDALAARNEGRGRRVPPALRGDRAMPETGLEPVTFGL